MTYAYVAEDTVTMRLGNRTAPLLDWDGDGTADDGLLAELIEDAGDVINARLAQRYGSSVPFAQITDTPATPRMIQRIALHLVLSELYSFAEPDGRDAVHHFGVADRLLTGLADGKLDIDVARAKASEGAVICVYSAETPVFSGEDTDGISRSRGI